ncbi:winged helix domain-containing protein [Sphingorhabdus lutea]|uniref:winged helix domain-containing protein n=1 Tax=Sphingorhabdus lutea TaxID=1913578 RepID=UPI000B2E7DF7|nr:helix-turn-helix domain-containing protein [Sphingorhabdus lutea]
MGQNARTLSALINSGKAGVTALELSSWAFRLGSYIHTLRSQYGLDIITIKETHNELGDWHARYVLNCDVQILEMA